MPSLLSGPALRRALPLLFVVLASSTVARGQDTSLADTEKVALPEAPTAWLNSPPLSIEGMRGKGIVLYFFDEQCPRCASQWASLQTLSTQYLDKPVVFVAVNSGTDPRALRAYGQRFGVHWPIVADVDRSVENALGVPLVTQQTSFHVKYIDAEGKLQQGTTDLPGTVAAALRGAKWRVDPKEVPVELQPAWRQIELGNFSEPAAALVRAAGKEGLHQDAAKTLIAAVEAEVAKDFTKAGEEFKGEHKWEAYKLLDAMTERYRGYDFATVKDQVDPALKKLAQDDEIRKQASARDALRKALAMLGKGTGAATRRAKGQLERLVASSGDTEAGADAKDLLVKLPQ
ncbi:MAG: peroxiredoxin family protein [Lacipirellulaceae bacterium]